MRKLHAIGLALILFLAVAPSWGTPNRVVGGYSASWFDGMYPAESYNYDAFTHIFRCFLIPKANGDITVSGDFWNPELEKRAHEHGVKMIASIGGASENADHWLAMARNPKSLKKFFDQLEKLITDNHYDGVDIDWEPSALTDADQKAYTDFMKKLRKRFPNWIITTALGGGEWWAQHVSWSEVAEQVDFINLMTYCFAGSWSGHSSYNSNLYPSKNPQLKDDTGIDEIVNRLETKYKVPADKIVLGLAFFGAQFFTPHMGDAFTGDKRKEGAEIQYYEAFPFSSVGGYSDLWDDSAKVPYFEKNGGGHVITYDNPKSIKLKCDYALEKNLKGVMMWNLGADITGDRTPLLDTIAQSFGVKPMALPAEGLAKTAQNFVSLVTTAYTQLSGSYEKIVAAGKKEEAKSADPGPKPDFTLPDSKDASALGKKILQLQTLLNVYNRKMRDCQKILDALPVTEVQGAKLSPQKGSKLLMDNFEKGGSENPLHGNWMTDCDHNNLGTTMNPIPFQPAKGGSKASPKFAAHVWGHFGKSAAPWPYAMLTGTLSSGGGAVDLNEFKSIQFWVKGNKKEYSLLMGRAAVQDYAHYRADFKTGPKWTKVTLTLADFKQPSSWGIKVPFKLNDVIYFAFSPAASFSDEDFDLWVDDVTLVK